MRLVCFGDSNTYGYDPRSYFGGRYPAEHRWVDLLALETGWDIENQGMNGRSIPAVPDEFLLRSCAAADGIVIMLGSNDLLQSAGADGAAAHMALFLRQLPKRPILLVAPPPMVPGTWVTEERLLTESRELPLLYEALSRRMDHVSFADAGKWGVELLFDGVHFSEAGHRAFAVGIREAMRQCSWG